MRRFAGTPHSRCGGARIRSNSFRTRDSTADRIGIWIGDPSPGLSSGCSTAATKSETTLDQGGARLSALTAPVPLTVNVVAAVVRISRGLRHGMPHGHVGSDVNAERLHLLPTDRWTSGSHGDRRVDVVGVSERAEGVRAR